MIVGLSGADLTPLEAAFLREAKPTGIIVFTRNAETPEQLRRLISDARDAIGEGECLTLVDQEGGRVQRLMPPHWRRLPAAETYGRRFRTDPDAAETAARMISELCAHELRALGLNTNCVPCADIPVSGANPIIGTRAYASDVATTVRLARIVAEAHLAAGILPVIKHIPGHGRAEVDSHLTLPIVDTPATELAASDFAAFKALRDLPAAMTAHVVYNAIDNANPATTSVHVLQGIVRGDIGFSGLLMSDDLSMKALAGDLGSRAAGAIAAGCDIALHCNGDLPEMQAVAANVPVLEGEALRRFQKCCAITQQQVYPLNTAQAEAALHAHLAVTA
ncbi:MAG: beta-N-acetylhexosaminidase [Hyphomicrobiaceae bacterium]